MLHSYWVSHDQLRFLLPDTVKCLGTKVQRWPFQGHKAVSLPDPPLRCRKPPKVLVIFIEYSLLGWSPYQVLFHTWHDLRITNNALLYILSGMYRVRTLTKGRLPGSCVSTHYPCELLFLHVLGYSGYSENWIYKVKGNANCERNDDLDDRLPVSYSIELRSGLSIIRI